MLTLIAAMSLALAAQQEVPKDPTNCELSSGWEALEGRKPTLMYLAQNQADFDDDDSVWVSFMNDDWSIEEDDKLGEIKVTGSGGAWFSNDAEAFEHGFGIWASYEHVRDVISSSSITVTRQGKKIDGLNTAGMSLDRLNFENCRLKKVSAKAERDRLQQLEKAIPKDPFAK